MKPFRVAKQRTNKTVKRIPITFFFRNHDCGSVFPQHIGVLLLMIIPIPTALLSVLLVLNVSIAVVVLLASMYIKNSLEFSSFPSMLLGITVFRLSLNIASTKLILLQGDAGEVVRAFGEVVVRGNAIVGFIIFIILVLIQFIVITKGSERVSEVAARFTLDAMPGKQMAIDADLNAGIIGEAEARTRRENIRREADFFGAMDGASKFVRGDAIASMIVVGVNIVGGVIMGFLQSDMSWQQILHTYTILTIGDGLVNQIPALFISTASGIIVTRTVSSGGNMSTEITSQVLAYPKALGIAAGILALFGFFGFFTGLPSIPFLFIAAILGGVVYAARTASPAEEEKAAAAAARRCRTGKA
jgi:flagellar biosynthesis protein FlhA